MAQYPGAMGGKPPPEKGCAYRGSENTRAQRCSTEARENVDGAYGQHHRVEFLGSRMGGP
eukprot:16434429-Heterocapsa_arctica.AAC.1